MLEGSGAAAGPKVGVCTEVGRGRREPALLPMDPCVLDGVDGWWEAFMGLDPLGADPLGDGWVNMLWVTLDLRFRASSEVFRLEEGEPDSPWLVFS